MQGCLGNRCRPLAAALVVGAAAAVLSDVVDEEPGVEAAAMADEAAFAAVARDAAVHVPDDCYAPGSVLADHRSRSCGCNYDRSHTQASASVTTAENAAVSVLAQVG